MLEVFNEPSSLRECGARRWKHWATGCGTETDEGMVTVGQYLRKLAPNNVLLFDGDGLPPMFTGFPSSVKSEIPPNSAYVIHPYFYNDGPNGWNTRFGTLQTNGSPVVATEWNEVSINCKHKEPQSQVMADQLIQNYLPHHRIGLTMHSWDAPGAVLADRFDDPVESVRNCSFPTAARLVYNQFWAEAGGKQPAPEVHVSSITKIGERLEDITVALASNGEKDGTPGPYIARSVDLLLGRPGQAHGPEMLARMKLVTTSPWAHGSFTLATASGLSHGRYAAKAGDSLTILVHYEGGATLEIKYAVH